MQTKGLVFWWYIKHLLISNPLLSCKKWKHQKNFFQMRQNTSHSPLHNGRLSCLRRKLRDPTPPGYNECTPEEHKTLWTFVVKEHIPPHRHHLSISPRRWEETWMTAGKGWLQKSGTVGGTESFPSCFPKDTFQKEVFRLEMLNVQQALETKLTSLRLLPLIANDGVNLASRLQLRCRGCHTFLHEQQQGLMGLLLYSCPYWHEGAQGDDVCLCYTC